MKKIIVLCMLCVFAGKHQAQIARTDSLRKLLYKTSDTRLQIDLYNQLYIHGLLLNDDSTYHYAEQAFLLALNTDFYAEKSEAFCYQANQLKKKKSKG